MFLTCPPERASVAVLGCCAAEPEMSRESSMPAAGKLQVFTAAIDGGYGWLAALAVVNTVASLFYYLRWLAPAFLQRPPGTSVTGDALEPAGRWAAAAAYTAGGGRRTAGSREHRLAESPVLYGRVGRQGLYERPSR
jgi:hypothetical protein